MNWKTINRPGVFGLKRDEILKGYDEVFGKNKWRIVHQYCGKTLNFLETCKLFEEAYFQDSLNRQDLWLNLMNSGSDVYDLDLTDIESGLNYEIQNGKGTHIQDIAIRNVFVRRNFVFEGQEPIQIRSCAKTFGYLLSPYSVKFHKPEHILQPHLDGLWKPDSVESFYQSNKLLQILN